MKTKQQTKQLAKSKVTFTKKSFGVPLIVIAEWRKEWIATGKDKVERFETFKNRKTKELKRKEEHAMNGASHA